MTRACSDCGKPVSVKSTGRCRTCANQVLNRRPDKRALNAAAMLRFCADPANTEKRRAASRKGAERRMADPSEQERLREWGRKVGSRNIGSTHTPEVRAKAGAAISAARLSHIPEPYRPMYRDFRAKGIKAPEAAQLVADQKAADDRRAIAQIDANLAAMRAKAAREKAMAY